MKRAFLFALASLAAVWACDSTTTEPTPSTPISISSPSNGATIRDVQVIRAVSGNEFHFGRVVFVIDGDSAATDSSAPYEYQWDIFQYASGTTHNIFAVGFQNDSVYVSSAVSVTIRYDSGFSFAANYSPGWQYAVGVTSFGNVLFVSYLDAGLEMLDIRMRTNPVFLARYFTSGQTRGSDVLFPYIYISDGDQGLAKAFFADVDSITPSDRFNTQNQSVDVAVSDNYIFSLENNGLSILSPSNLDLFSQITPAQDIFRRVVARHDTAFIIGNSALYIVDGTSPRSPHIVSTFDNLELAKSVAVEDSFVFIANGADGVMALSIANPSSPRFLARYNPGFIATAVDAGDGVLFAGFNSGLVYALRFSTPGSLEELDQYDMSLLIQDIYYDFHYVYVAANNSVAILRFAR